MVNTKIFSIKDLMAVTIVFVIIHCIFWLALSNRESKIKNLEQQLADNQQNAYHYMAQPLWLKGSYEFCTNVEVPEQYKVDCVINLLETKNNIMKKYPVKYQNNQNESGGIEI